MQRTLATWIQRVQSSHLWQNAGRPVKQSPVAQSGVSVEYLRLLLESLGDLLAGADTAVFVSKAILPLTQKKRSRVYDFIPAAFTGRPDYYVVHAWQGSFHDLINQIVNQAQEHGSPLRDIYVWLDIVALDQHPSVTAIPDLTQVRELVTVCTSGALVMGEYGHLQQVLSDIPRLNEDCNTLDDIKAIYEVGTLDEDEFIEESKEIFNEVNIDRDDTVSLQEFEMWWINVHMAPGVITLSPATLKKDILKIKLIKMLDYAIELELDDTFIQQFKQCVQDMKDGKLLGEQYPEDLAPNSLRGEWENIAELCLLKINNSAIKSSMKTMYDLFKLNQDQLVVNINKIPSPRELADDPMKMAKMLPTYLQVVIYLISLEWGLRSQNISRYLQETIDQLKKPGAIVALGALHDMITSEGGQINQKLIPVFSLLHQAIAALGALLNMIAADGGQINQKGTVAAASYNYQTIIKNMVALKYGASTPVSKQLITEAEKALGQFRAATKKGEPFSGTRDYLGKCGVSTCPALTVEAKAYSVRREIPAEGHYRSLLADLGPDAHAYLEEIADEHEGGFEHSQQYLDELLDKKTECKLLRVRSKQVFVQAAPSFSNPTPGTFEKDSGCKLRDRLQSEGLECTLRDRLQSEGPVQSEGLGLQVRDSGQSEGPVQRRASGKVGTRWQSEGTRCKVDGLGCKVSEGLVQSGTRFESEGLGLQIEDSVKLRDRCKLRGLGCKLRDSVANFEGLGGANEGTRCNLRDAVCKVRELEAKPVKNISRSGLATPSYCSSGQDSVKNPEDPTAWFQGRPPARAPIQLAKVYSTSVVTASALNHLATSAEGSVQQFTAGLKTIIPGLPPQGSSSTACCPPSVLSSRQNRRTWTNGADSSGRRGSSSSEMYQIELPKKEVSYSIAAPRQEKSSPLWRPSDKETSGGTVRRRTSYNGLEP
eukprot:gene27007-9025_t